ncbi:tRNA pseudouridine(38-40) synthase TruA [Varunaivibrio sulfuroxidans]|uniref:tRNA pseudouridine synthase A n=1 Tax=Varunaivibrio sulfuroxidans TaxID=1773489 RepID=A0A4R3JFV5_9PROT|nr:tRNA pseudouridine(38-40) synthase TruA [Varunaivibrio sulfuroxidans]TCS65018.1 tRNA pseudouridine38-40 synthase [Varunaivibrio sulfuroxidans]WES29692.1 tRNA pseudouridine(38-40) synthase TruA [Varunaivibrio sulfuroxidans]
MHRYRITIEYDGGPFVGWQRQINGPSVQQAIEDAIHAFSGETVTLFGAGRTDAGVHALGQVAHFDLERYFPAHKVHGAVNAHLRDLPIVLRDVEAVDENFHARFSARERTYLYRILNRPARPALDKGRVWWVPQPLDAAAMHAAAQTLTGKHDFTTFRAKFCQAKSPVKTLDTLDIARRGEEIVVSVQARSFLHHQVRNLVGTLKLVGEGKWTAQDITAALAACDRAAGGPTAPAAGLYLVEVRY